MLIDASSGLILMTSHDREWMLPRIDIPRWTRATSHVLERVRREYHLDAVILDEFEYAFPMPSVIVAEAIAPSTCRLAKDDGWKRLADLAHGELRDEEIAVVSHLLSTGATERGPFSRLRWLDDVLAWTASNIGVESADIRIHQVNGNSVSALIRMDIKDKHSLWFKAQADQCDSEYAVTKTLHQAFPEYLPTILAHCEEWRAWLMEDAGLPLEGLLLARPRLMEEIGRQLASLQQKSQHTLCSFLDSGASDQRATRLSSDLPEILDQLSRASGGEVGPFNSRAAQRKKHIELRLQELIAELAAIQIPDTLVHGDLNLANVLIDDGTCVFTDWTQTSIGNPIANLEQLRLQVLYNSGMSLSYPRLLAGYERAWSSQLSHSQVARALKLIPPVALCMYLQSRRQWFAKGRLPEAIFGRFARNISRQLERAVIELEEGLAHTA